MYAIKLVTTACLPVCMQVLELLLDRKAADARHAREVSAWDAELTRLQDYIDHELSELQQRQSQVGRYQAAAAVAAAGGLHTTAAAAVTERPLLVLLANTDNTSSGWLSAAACVRIIKFGHHDFAAPKTRTMLLELQLRCCIAAGFVTRVPLVKWPVM
jgi:hypothetical protein